MVRVWGASVMTERMSAAAFLEPRNVFAGIGSRDTPPHQCRRLTEVSAYLGKQGWGLRSGGANGADWACEQGADMVAAPKTIFLPWVSFNGNRWRHDDRALVAAMPFSDKCLSIAEQYHPRWTSLTDAAMKLMARNVYQVLGVDLASPVNIVLCWTSGGRVVGGTGQALRIATAHDVPIVNLGDRRYSDEPSLHIADRIVSQWSRA